MRDDDYLQFKTADTAYAVQLKAVRGIYIGEDQCDEGFTRLSRNNIPVLHLVDPKLCKNGQTGTARTFIVIAARNGNVAVAADKLELIVDLGHVTQASKYMGNEAIQVDTPELAGLFQSGTLRNMHAIY